MNDDEQKSKVESLKSNGGDNKASTHTGDTDPATNNLPPTTSELEAKCEEYLNGWKRALADYENLQKSIAQNRQADRRRLIIDLAESLLPVIDNFGYVMKHVPDARQTTPEFQKAFNTWFKGIEHIDRQFSESMKSLGVEPIETIGKKFDPHFHESGGSKKDDSKEDGVVLEELIKGWKIGDVVLRPAKVIVNYKTST